jgi:hypothetical protein
VGLNLASLCALLDHPENPRAHFAHELFARFLADGLAALADGHGEAPLKTGGKFFCGNVSERDSGKKNKPRGPVLETGKFFFFLIFMCVNECD